MPRTVRAAIKRSCRVAIIQHPPVFLNLDASVARAEKLIARAARGGAQLIAFPETWLPGYPVWLDECPGAALWDHAPAKAIYRVLANNSIAVPGPHVSRLKACAKEHQVVIVMGANERSGRTLYNSILYFDAAGRGCTVHRKLIPTYTERLVWGQGDGSTLATIDTPFGIVGGLVCWEHWMPLARAAMHARNESIHVAQWPTVREMHQVASRHYAFEGQCFVLAAGGVLTRGEAIAGLKSHRRDVDEAALSLLETIPGDDARPLLRGGSAIIAPNGDYLAGPVFDRAEIVHAELPLDLITEGALTLDTAGHYSRPDVFQLEVNESPSKGIAFRKRPSERPPASTE